MSEHFVKYIKIERYKCFSDFSVDGFKRINLISGKNNVGKTALMEAIAANVYSNSAQALIGGLGATYNYRNVLDKDDLKAYSTRKSDYIKNQAGDVQTITNINSISFDSNESGILRHYSISINGHISTIPESDMDIDLIIKNIPKPMKNICFINSRGDSQEEIIKSFSAIQKKDKETDLNRAINEFDDSITSVKIIGGNSLECRVIGANGADSSYRKLNDFGDGLRHYINIIADLFNAENSYLFIDELDSGIHYSSLDQMWEIILTISNEQNVQVFATTHSRECIESYCRVAVKLKEQDISFTTLVKNKEKAVKAIIRDHEVFTNSIHDEREVRGW